MSEDQIERVVERLMDNADRAFMKGTTDQAGYDRAVKEIDAWAKAELAKGRRW